MGFLLLLLYEFSILMACVSIFYMIGRGESMTRLKLAVLVISTSMAVSSLIATVLSFLQTSDTVYYLLLAGALAAALNLLALVGGGVFGRGRYGDFLCGLAHSAFESLFSRKALALLLLLLPLLFSVIRPPDEADSLAVLHSVLSMASSHQTPYSFYWNYVAFWELSYVPSLTITSSDNFLWLVSVKPVILIGLGVCLAGRALGLPRLLIPLAALSAIMFFHFWIPTGASGIATVKNDMIFGAGVIFLAHYLIRTGSPHTSVRLSDTLIFLLGGIFVLSKYSGLPVLMLALILLVVANRRRLLGAVRRPHAPLLCAAAVLATTGHYYLKNLIMFQNPVYPFKLAVGEIGFQNGFDYVHGTSILSSLGDPLLWEHLLPTEPARMYVLLPVYAGMAAILAFLAHAMARRAGGSTAQGEGPLLSGLFVLGAWGVFASSAWSASALPGDMVYLDHLTSLRYAVGTAALTTLFLVYALWRAGVPSRILAALLAAHAGVAVLGLYQFGLGKGHLAAGPDAWLLVPPAICILALLAMGGRIRGLRERSLALLLAAVTIFALSPPLIELNREYWMGPYNEIVLETYRQDGASIALVPELLDAYPEHAYLFNYPTLSQNLTQWTQWSDLHKYVYPFSGNRFQHDVTMVNEMQLVSGAGNVYFEKSGLNQRPDYLVRWCHTPDACGENIQGFAERMGDYGYSIKKVGDHGIVLHYDASRPVPGAKAPSAP